MSLVYFDLKKNCFFSFLIVLQSSLCTNLVLAENNKFNLNNQLLDGQSNLKEKEVSKKSNQINSQYLLDSGDVIFIENIGLEVLNRRKTVDLDGYIDLPEIGKILVRNKTIKYLEREISKKYEEFVIDPTIKVSIKFYRPVDISVIGEVTRPGLYTLNYKSIVVNKNNLDTQLNNQNLSSQGNIRPPRVFDLLKKANGFTNYADLSKVKLIRNYSDDGKLSKIETELNIFDLILFGDQSKNIRLKDKDLIIVPKSDQILKDQILKISKSNINDGLITVFLTGNIVTKGPSIIKAGSSLNQAIAMNGGKKLLSGKVEFIRFNSDGSAQRDIFNYRKNALINTKYNPILMDGDIVNIRRSPYNYGKEVIVDFVTPITNIYTIFKIFE